jgi:hypothetical protein
MEEIETGQPDTKRIKHAVEIVTLGGTAFKGEITSRNSRGIFIKIEGKTCGNNSVFISHQAISHIEIID